MSRKQVLFLCTHNSSRSQMAEAVMNNFLSENYEAFSAGTEVTEVNRFAIEAMNELGVDMSSHYSKHLGEFDDMKFDVVVTVCDSANENCPVYLKGENHVHKSFRDPTAFKGSEEEKRQYFIEVRDEIRDWINEYF